MKKIFTFLIGIAISVSSISQAYETIHFHFDKDVYLPGETIWYKAYLYNNTQPAVTSTNLYCALYDAGGSLLQQKQYPIFEAAAKGDFILPDTMASGKFIFRAFTQTMLQQDSANVYQQVITVIGKNKKSAPPVLETAASHIRFFPEGGHLLANTTSYLGIRTCYTDGTPLITKGVIKNGSEELGSFETDANGMALVQLMLEANAAYSAEWTNEQGHIQKTALPPVKEYGVALHAEITGNQLFYLIAKNTTAPNLDTLRLVAQQGANVVYSAKLLMHKAMKAIDKFGIDSLPSGLLLITLYDSYWNPIAQRTLLVNGQTPPLRVNVTVLTHNKAPKKKNTIEITIPDSIKTNLSVSIADAGFYSERKNSLTENLLLVGNKANQPIDNVPPSQLANLFSLNHHWPMKAAGQHTNEPVAIDNYLGMDFNSSKRISEKEALMVIVKDKLTGNQFFEIPAAGKSFIQHGFVFFDSAKISYQMKKDKDLVDNITLNANNGLQIPTTIPPLKIVTSRPQSHSDPSNDTTLLGFLNNKTPTFNAVQTLQQVTVKSRYVNPETKRQMELEEKYATGPYKGLGRGYIINVMDDPIAENMVDIYTYIGYRVNGLSVVNTGLGGKKFITNRASGLTSEVVGEPVIFINEQESFNEELQTIPITQIAYVKFTPGIVAMSSQSTSNGALYVYLKKGNEQQPPAKHMRSLLVKGYNSTATFLQPDYDNNPSSQIDRRSTLYWNPYVITDAANPTYTIEYYNNDLSKKLLLVIQGMDEKGRLVHIEKVIE